MKITIELEINEKHEDYSAELDKAIAEYLQELLEDDCCPSYTII